MLCLLINKYMEIITRKEAKEKGLKRYYTGNPCKNYHYSERNVKTKACYECSKIRTKKYRGTVKGKIKCKEYEQGEKFKQHQKEYRQSVRGKEVRKEYEQGEKFKADCKKYRQSVRGKEVRKEYIDSGKFKKVQNKHRQSDKYKATRKRYSKTDKCQKYSKQLEQSEKCKATRKRYRESDEGKKLAAATSAKYRASEHGKATRKKYCKNNPEKIFMVQHQYLQRKEQAIPPWYEADLVKQIYLKRDELSELWGITLHVDHIVPLQGKNVSGLHCWDNLQLLEGSLNSSKSNKFDQELY